MKIPYCLIVLFFLGASAKAQTPNHYQPYSFDFYQKLNDKVYDNNTGFHSSIKPYFQDDSLLKASIDSFKNIAPQMAENTASKLMISEATVGLVYLCPII